MANFYYLFDFLFNAEFFNASIVYERQKDNKSKLKKESDNGSKRHNTLFYEKLYK